MESVRPAAVAGSFYPSDPQELRHTVIELIRNAVVPEAGIRPRLFIVPHAGYIYSGPVAATAYRLFEAMEGTQRVVAVGPSHFFEFAGLATPDVEGLATPLGTVPIDDDLRVIAESHPSVVPNGAAHAREHSLEVQLPFLQVVTAGCAILPLLTGRVAPATVADVLGSTMAHRDVVGVVSSDLSHYLDYQTARDRDQRTAASITQLQPDRLSWGDACGLVGIQGALLLAQREGWECALLDLRSSGDTAGDRDRVVGYGSFVIGPARSSRRP